MELLFKVGLSLATAGLALVVIATLAELWW